MPAAANAQLDKAVWGALNCHDLWFPPDIPLQGPHWQLEPLDGCEPRAGYEGWLRLEARPPVSIDWNLAMYAAHKVMLLPDASGMIRNKPIHSVISDGQWSVNIGGAFYLGDGQGPATVCYAILKYRGVECP